jgi:hypothetical protein
MNWLRDAAGWVYEALGVVYVWLRELAGWVLVALGVLVFYFIYLVLNSPGPWLIEAIFLTVIGVMLFRGGMQLLKMSVAGRVCLRAQARLQQEERAREHKPVRRTLKVEGRAERV